MRFFMIALIVFSVLQCAYSLSSTDIDTILNAHNAIRAKYGVAPLKWDADIATGAQSYSDQCIWGHSGLKGYGENIGYSGTYQGDTRPFPWYPVDTTVNSWNGEESGWNCLNSAACSGCGHFTQDIWSDTTSVGCGFSQCTFSGYPSQYLVCRYYPPGNYGGEHPLTGHATSATNPPKCPGSIPSSPVTAPTKAPTTAPVTAPTKAPTTAPVTAPTTAPSSGGFQGCKVSCNGKALYCLATPQIMNNKVYCKCGTETMLWGVTNAGTDACPYWPANVPRPNPYDKCYANYNGQTVACTGAPQQYSDGHYCPCGDPDGYSWPLTNPGTTDCQYGVANSESDTTATTSSGLTAGQWAGICVGIVVFAVIVVAIVVVKSRRGSEFV